MTTAFAILLLLHGWIHLLGAARAFGWADLSQLTQSISQARGVLWLVSALLFTATATALFVWPRGWWLIGASAFAAIPFFLPDAEGLVLPGLPLAALMFVVTLAAAPGTTNVTGPEDPRFTPWPWGLVVFLLLVLLFFLTVLQGGVSIDPRAWGSAQ